MRVIARALPAAAAVFLVCGAPLRAAEPPPEGKPATDTSADEPSIEEMLAVIEAARSAEKAALPEAGPASAPKARRTVPAPKARRTASAPKAPPDVEAQMKDVKVRANRVAPFYQRHRKIYNLADLSMKFDNHRRALQIIAEMLRKKQYNAGKSPVANAMTLGDRRGLYYLDRYGEYGGCADVMYAKSAICLGGEKEAAKALATAKAKQGRQEYVYSPHRKDLELAVEFVAGYAQAKEKLEELEAALAETPSAELQWEYVTLCSPPANRAVKHLKWLEGLLVMITKYPEHKSVASGLAHWQLFHAYRAFAMHEKCIEVLDELIGKHAKIHLHVKPWNIHEADPHWEKANSWSKLGLLQDELKDRSALVSYRKALECFQLFKKSYPKDSRCVPGESGVSTLQRRVAALGVAIGRFTK
ncbi:MAG: hypothetical protein ACYTFI_07870 [Planctomycetota bacterium]|jgi:tetratricopeptide (TPR) repeat protein